MPLSDNLFTGLFFLIEDVALSFDKPYKQSELPLYELPELPEMTWFWMNTYNESELKRFQQE